MRRGERTPPSAAVRWWRWALAAVALSLVPATAAGLTLDDLVEDMRVEVKLGIDGDKLEAKRVTLKVDAGDEVELTGPATAVAVSAASTTDTAPVVLFELIGRPIVAAPGVRVRGASDVQALLDAARAGQWVKIRGLSVGDMFEARTLELRDQRSGRPEVEGPISSLRRRDAGRARLKIGGFKVYADRGTEYEIDDAAIPAAAQLRRVPLALDALDDDDLRPRSLSLWRGRVSVGGQLGWRMTPELEYDLDSNAESNQVAGLMTVELEAGATLTPQLAALVKVGMARVVGIQEPPGVNIDDTTVQVREAHLTWANLSDRTRGVFYARVGRQDFDERREWLFDENLDAVRLGWQGPRKTRIETSVGGYLRSTHPVDQHLTYLIATASTAVTRRSSAGAYFIRRNDPTTDDDDSRWLGLRSFGSLANGLGHWVEAAWQRGNHGGLRRHGRAFDVGVSVLPPALFNWRGPIRELRPSLTLGYAVGSGDPDGSDGSDDAFRQTGLDDNNDKFMGVTSFRYYGELLEPELTNLQITTVGVGVRPMRKTSIDIVYHRYRQVEPHDRLRGANVGRPTGDSTDIGSELDLVLGYEEIPNLDLELIVASFTPGAAFSSTAPMARGASLQLRYRF